MPFKTFTPGVLTASDVNTFLMQQAVITCTSTTRPASPVEGMTIYETNNDLYRTWDGTAWQPLVSPTEVYAATTNITIGDGTLVARYARLGSFYIYQFRFEWGSTTSFGAEPFFRISAPTTIGSFTDGSGISYMIDSSAAVTYAGTLRLQATGNWIQVRPFNPSGTYLGIHDFSNTVPFTWAAGDFIWGSFVYRVN
jgi:hypothetical protein